MKTFFFLYIGISFIVPLYGMNKTTDAIKDALANYNDGPLFKTALLQEVRETSLCLSKVLLFLDYRPSPEEFSAQEIQTEEITKNWGTLGLAGYVFGSSSTILDRSNSLLSSRDSVQPIFGLVTEALDLQETQPQ